MDEDEAQQDEPKTAYDRVALALLKRRQVALTGSIYDNTARDAAEKLEYLAAESDEPITLIVTSPGGSVFAGLALYDTIISLGVPVTVEVRGYAASMGAVILQAGTERVATPNARLLIHEVSAVSFISNDTATDSEEKAKQLRALNDTLFGIIVARSGVSLSDLNAKARRQDWWLDAPEALALNLIDRIAGRGK